MQLVEASGIDMSPSRLSRLIRSHIRELRTIANFDHALAYLLTYADPTGEEAVRNATSRPVIRRAPITTVAQEKGASRSFGQHLNTCLLHGVAGCSDCRSNP